MKKKQTDDNTANFNEHQRPVDKQTNISKPTTVSKHFLTNDHTANDISLISLELIHCNGDNVRKMGKNVGFNEMKPFSPLSF